MSKCDLLPERSIFQIVVPYAKVVENALYTFNSMYSVGLENMAYREKLSTTALLINQFDIFARILTVFGFNGDQKKAFDRNLS